MHPACCSSGCKTFLQWTKDTQQDGHWQGLQPKRCAAVLQAVDSNQLHCLLWVAAADYRWLEEVARADDVAAEAAASHAAQGAAPTSQQPGASGAAQGHPAAHRATG